MQQYLHNSAKYLLYLETLTLRIKCTDTIQISERDIHTQESRLLLYINKYDVNKFFIVNFYLSSIFHFFMSRIKEPCLRFHWQIKLENENSTTNHKHALHVCICKQEKKKLKVITICLHPIYIFFNLIWSDFDVFLFFFIE